MVSKNGPAQTVEQTPVALLSMPFAPLFSPSIGLGLLKAGLQRRGIRSQDFYFTLSLAERIGTHQYINISNSTVDLLGEWIFSRSLFGHDEAEEQGYIDDVLHRGSPHHRKDNGWHGESSSSASPEVIQLLVSLRDQDAFLDDCVERILAIQPAIVAFTSVFQQQLASLALAKRLKARNPGLTVC